MPGKDKMDDNNCYDHLVQARQLLRNAEIEYEGNQRDSVRYLIDAVGELLRHFEQGHCQ